MVSRRLAIGSRVIDKVEHILFCLGNDSQPSAKSGFENFCLAYNSLPEIDFDEIDTSCVFLGRKINVPLMISPMTGGSALSKIINRNLALAAQEVGVAMGVGSQKLAIEDPSLEDTYRVRDVAPDIPLVANLGAVYLNYGYGLEECEKAVTMIGADALSLYLNPLQKVLQSEGKANFRNLLPKIKHICENLHVPVIVKDIGCGMSGGVARALEDAGVAVLDVAGIGGTSWAKITRILKGLPEDTFCHLDDFGIPTAESLIDVRKSVEKVKIIASGGIRTGIDMAKAFALGADLAGMAYPFLLPALHSPEAVITKLRKIIRQLKISLFSCGVTKPSELTSEHVSLKPRGYMSPNE